MIYMGWTNVRAYITYHICVGPTRVYKFHPIYTKTGVQKRTKLSCALLRRRCASWSISSNFFPWACALSSSQVRSSRNLLSSFEARSIKEKKRNKNSKYARWSIPSLCNGGCNTSYPLSQIRLASFYITKKRRPNLTLPKRACHSHPEKIEISLHRYTKAKAKKRTEDSQETQRTKLAKTLTPLLP